MSLKISTSPKQIIKWVVAALLGIDIAADMPALFKHKHLFACIGELSGAHCTEKPGTDYQIIIHNKCSFLTCAVLFDNGCYRSENAQDIKLHRKVLDVVILQLEPFAVLDVGPAVASPPACYAWLDLLV